MSQEISRRDFFRTAGAAAFTLGAVASGGIGAGCPMPVTEENFVYTACDICMIRCAMKVYIDDAGKAVFVEGNPADPFNKGKLCPKGKAALGFLYNDDRLLYPLKRTNTATKGIGVDPQWEQITWEEAYSSLVSKMKENTNDFANGEQFAFFSHGNYGNCKRLLSAIGSPNLVSHYDTCFSPSFIARKAITGGTCWTNLAGATYILSFGWDQPDRCKDQPTIQFAEALKNGCKVVCFNPFQGTVGAKADTWIPIKPGTDLSVMLVMINYIISNDLYDSTAIAKTNFSEHESSIRSNFSTYTASWAEGISGVPASTIETIAKDFAAAEKAILPVHKRDGATGPGYANSHHAAHAAYILNALVGAVDRDGGDACVAFGWSPKAPLAYEEDPPTGYNDLITAKGAIDGKHEFPLVQKLIEDRGIFANVAQRILDKNPYELKMAIFRRYGILSFPNPKKIAQALATLDSVVFIDTMPKEIMWFADLVLPESTFLEGSGISYRKFCTPGYKMVMSQNKAISPLGESKGWGSVVFELGKRLDEERGTQYFKLKGGDWVTGSDEKASMANEIKEGLTLDDILNAEKGVYIKEQAPYASKSEYSTTSGKIEIYSSKMEDAEYDPLPSWIAKEVEPDSTYPLYLLIRRWAGLKHSAPLSSNNPYALDAFPRPVALLHTSAAATYGISDGDMVWIESVNGKMKAEARVSERIRPDCVMTNHNYGHTVEELSNKFSDQGDGNLIVDRSEARVAALKDWSGNAWMLEVCVKVYKA
jgi:thiosulfate reductase/polysulfide reductase chain A